MRDKLIEEAFRGVDVAQVADVEVLPREPTDAAGGIAPGYFRAKDKVKKDVDDWLSHQP